MRNLSVMEQKQVVGGYYCCKVYQKGTGVLLGKYYGNTKELALQASINGQNGQVGYPNNNFLYSRVYVKIK